MQKSFPLFLRKLHLARKSFKESDILELLKADDFEELKNLGLLKRCSDSKMVICTSCDEPHPIQVHCDGGNPYTCCISDSKPNILNPSKIRKWELNVQNFLQAMTNKFGIEESIEALELEGLWHMGTINKDQSYYVFYFYHGKKGDEVVEFLKNKAVGFEHQMVVNCKQGDLAHPKGSGVLFLDAGILIDLKEGELKFDKKLFQRHLSAFREVQFEPDSGNLRVNGELIVTIPLKTTHYYFSCHLWKQFSVPISNSKVKKYVCEKRGRSYDRDTDQFCHDQRGKIKALAKGDERKEKLIASIFVTLPTKDGQNGSVMQNPT